MVSLPNSDWIREVQERGGCLYCMECGFDDEGQECMACYGTGLDKEKGQAFTIGALEIYEKNFILYKGTGGSVWQYRSQAFDYFNKIGGKVSLMGRSVDAGVYEVWVPNGWDKDTKEVLEIENASWRSLTTYARIVSRIKP